MSEFELICCSVRNTALYPVCTVDESSMQNTLSICKSSSFCMYLVMISNHLKLEVLTAMVILTILWSLIMQEMKNSSSTQTQPIPLLDCAAGLVELAAKKYKDAAKHFLKCQFDNCDFPEVIY